jgi:cellulose synthase/poly-beta-1,6-N-acetylglucosamine synthase-like glycosyltransferase
MWIEIVLFSYFCFVVSYSLLFSVAGLFYRNPRFKTSPEHVNNRIAVLIPSYKEDGVIVHIAKQALLQSYPSSYYKVIVIADSLQQSTLDELRKLEIVTHEVHFDNSTKVKSLQSVLNAQQQQFDVAVILDADNIMEKEFLVKINHCFNNGWTAIQGQRTAKNKNTSFAILDGLSEVIANHINRQGAYTLGLSSPLIGSGMAFQFSLLHDVINQIDPNCVAEDKELQIAILRNSQKIHYLKNAIVFDEKVDNVEVFQNQRKRWMRSHYDYAKKLFFPGLKSLVKGQFSIFNIAILLNIQLPRLMNLGLLTFLTLISLLFHNFTFLPFWYWCLAWLGYALSFFLAIPLSWYNKAFFVSMLAAPKALFAMLLLHFKLKGSSKKFIHTPHKHS